MLTVDQYAASVIANYQINRGAGSPSQKAADAMIPLLKRFAGPDLLGITLSGAYAKGTAITLSSHVDVHISLRLSPETEVRNVFWKLFEYLGDQNFRPHTRNVSMQVESNGLRVDLLPAWRTTGSDEILYHKEPGRPVQTNVTKHIHLISNSGRAQEICALKIWRERHALEFPSFQLELATLRALEGQRFGQLAGNVFTALRYLSSHFEKTVIRDPANADNVISDELTPAQKKQIIQAARKAVDDDDWEKIVW